MQEVSRGQRLDNDREDPWGGWGKSGVSSRWQTCWWLRRGAGRYLESLPVGPNQSDSVLTPGLFLQSPELPASLFGGGREETESRNKWSRRRWEGEEVDTVLPEVRNIKCAHTHCTQAQCDHWETVKLQLCFSSLQKPIWKCGSWEHLSGELLEGKQSWCFDNFECKRRKQKVTSQAVRGSKLILLKNSTAMQKLHMHQLHRKSCRGSRQHAVWSMDLGGRTWKQCQDRTSVPDVMYGDWTPTFHWLVLTVEKWQHCKGRFRWK